MPALQNPKWERFAIGVAKGLKNADAYIRAGYKPGSRGNAGADASKLLQREDIRERIAELQGKKVVTEPNIDKDYILSELDEMIALARKTRSPSSGVSAIIAKAKILGLIVDKNEADGSIRRPMREPGDVGQMTLEEWKKRFAPASEATDLPAPEVEG